MEVQSDTSERMNTCVLPAVVQEETQLQLRGGGYITPPKKKGEKKRKRKKEPSKGKGGGKASDLGMEE